MAKSSIATLKITIYNVQISLQLYSKTKKTLQYLESESCNIEKLLLKHLESISATQKNNSHNIFNHIQYPAT
jgi:hypothetical protein